VNCTNYIHQNYTGWVLATPTPTASATITCLWNGMQVLGTTTCEYDYGSIQRRAAANYAYSWTTKACNLFCTFEFKPYVQSPIATVDYTCGAPKATDCANFISQAFVIGGLPMTKNWYCSFANASPICIRGNDSKGYWAGAPRTGGLPEFLANIPNGEAE